MCEDLFLFSLYPVLSLSIREKAQYIPKYWLLSHLTKDKQNLDLLNKLDVSKTDTIYSLHYGTEHLIFHSIYCSMDVFHIKLFTVCIMKEDNISYNLLLSGCIQLCIMLNGCILFKPFMVCIMKPDTFYIHIVYHQKDPFLVFIMKLFTFSILNANFPKCNVANFISNKVVF